MIIMHSNNLPMYCDVAVKLIESYQDGFGYVTLSSKKFLLRVILPGLAAHENTWKVFDQVFS